VLHRDGQACSSDEVAVMVMERRGLATMLISNGQLIKQEEPSEISKTVCYFQAGKWWELYERRRSRTVLGGAEGEIPSVYSTLGY